MIKIERQIVTIMRSVQILCRPHKKVYDNLQIKEKRQFLFLKNPALKTLFQAVLLLVQLIIQDLAKFRLIRKRV